MQLGFEAGVTYLLPKGSRALEPNLFKEWVSLSR